MFSAKQLTALFLFCLIAYIPYFTGPGIGGWDSYHYLSALSIPQSAFLWVKVATFLAMFASVLSIAYLGNRFTQNGWIAGILVFGSPVFLMEFWKFENDTFAFPILFLSLALFFNGKRGWAVLTLLPAFILWQGSAIYLVALGLNWIPLFIVSVPLICFILWEKAENFLPNLAIQENFPVFGALYQFFLLFGIGYLPKALARTTMFFFILAFMNAKFAVHATPLLAVGLACMFDKTKWMSLKALAVAGPIIVLMLMSSILFTYPPTAEQTVAVQLAQREAQGETIYNDWDTGHVLEYYGGHALAKSGGKQPDLNCTNCVVLTRQVLPPPCSCINCPSTLTVYRC